MNDSLILAIDIGGTAVKLGLVDLKGNLHARAEESVCFDGYQTPILTTVVRAAAHFLRQTNASVCGVGVSATGQIDARTGTVIGTNGKIPGYEGAPIRAALEDALHLETHVLNDANAAALGECFAGRAKGVEHVLMVTLGTGVGGGLVLGGKIYLGARGIAGELGHFPIDRAQPPCPCGGRGCFESYASTTALVRLARETTGESALTGRDVFSRAQVGDAVMLALLDRWIDDIAAGLSGLIHIFNPEMVLIGGGVSAQEALLMEPLRQRTLARTMPRFREGLSLCAASLGNDAGLIGAAKFFMEQTKDAAQRK